jgi:hypothetical protein
MQTVTMTAGADLPQSTSASAERPSSDGPRAARKTPMILPLPANHLNYTGVDIGPPDANGGGMSNFYYQRDETDNSPTIRFRSTASVNVASKDVDREGCVTALRTAPTKTPIRDLRKGMLFCVGETGDRDDVALFEIDEAPDKAGALKVTEYFWPGS